MHLPNTPKSIPQTTTSTTTNTATATAAAAADYFNGHFPR